MVATGQWEHDNDDDDDDNKSRLFKNLRQNTDVKYLEVLLERTNFSVLIQCLTIAKDDLRSLKSLHKRSPLS
jgi:hypothetical protein